ncbi:PP2C family protein-serine/threonine phosphatase [Chondromyces apiculatus]|uniref:Protein serine/threonine phosphatase PrpC, regulation of stationary phase n=1 Tax=Chondromyces apiculatus DSM 436 TaxID=1192034 RepID=A0A017TEA5_9BACT|nr:protein phosphatase 2C domain-containing protein [Chondromyces apiculatus]EYF07613.1 Protein serine/threonine phosphatase PrpC, regulation of stationary phase [Chondromyces apiculatus DSM 436]
MTRLLRIEAAGATDVGRQREHNEDSFASDADLGLFIVADGIGGAASGEVASKMAVDVVHGCCADEQDVEITRPSDLKESQSPIELRLLSCLWQANKQIFDTGMRDLRHRGMATTFAGMLVAEGMAYIAHVGDSRVYRFRSGQLTRLTEDHSLHNEFARRGEILPEGIDPIIARSVVTRALGMERTVEVELRMERVEAGDAFLVCSDGLTGPVPDDDIVDVLAAAPDVESAVDLLIELANQRGGPDNVTCVVVRFLGTS